MKSASKLLIVASLAFTVGATSTSAKAAVVYEYPREYSIEARALGFSHRLNTTSTYATATVPEESKLDVVVTFPPNSDKLSPKATTELAKAAALIKSSKGIVHVLVEGHSDSSGKVTRNQELSYRRAVRVVHTLVKKYGVPAQLALAKGFGSMKPVATNATSDGRAANRRVDFVLINQ